MELKSSFNTNTAEIFLTIKAELRPAFFMFMTTPSNACNLVLSPSLTFTDTTTVSPGLE